MEKLKNREHDFSSKLRQHSVLPKLKNYIEWQRCGGRSEGLHKLADFGPVSINLDLTSACNFACPHCVDSGIVNNGASHLAKDSIMRTLDILTDNGLRSVILLGGGEPTLHSDFEEVAGYIKSKGLQLGISTNGSRLDRVARIAAQMEPKDWVRISIDAASEDTFVQSHRPKSSILMHDILRGAREIKECNPHITFGFSFVIVWDGIITNGHMLCANVHEMAEAVQLASRYWFDYVSFKPCLIRLNDSQRESLLYDVEEQGQKHIAETLRSNLQKARRAAGRGINIIESINLQALLTGKVSELKTQPVKCHMQFFRTVVSPSGIFHCPACRGMEAARLAGPDGYVDKENFDRTFQATEQSVEMFDASRECSVVGCFYHYTNWWLEEIIRSDVSIEEIEHVADDNFFL